MAGRPTKFDTEKAKRILDALREGHTRAAASAAGHVSYQTFLNWIEAGRKAKSGQFFDFFEAVQEAENEAFRRVEGIVINAVSGGDAKMALEFLKRRHRPEWGDNVSIELDRRFEDILASVDPQAEGRLFAED